MTLVEECREPARTGIALLCYQIKLHKISDCAALSLHILAEAGSASAFP